jgi:CubicO group peptidase (beta-lactamase class C family)
MAAVTLRADRILNVDAVGVRCEGRSQQVDASSEFHLGSLAKAITATMLATLIDEGKLSWQTRPLDVFPEWSGAVLHAYANVTLDDLFRHRAGLPPYQPLGAAELRGFPASASRAECARWVLGRQPANQPGTVALYSNAGPCIAAVMAERVTGHRWEHLLRDRVFAPLGMHAGFGWPAAVDPTQPWGHRPSWLGPRPVSPGTSFPLPDFFRPAGDVRMTLGHYGRFLQSHLAGLLGRDSLLRAGTVQHLHTPVDGCGLGWGVGTVDGVMTSGHAGGAGSFLAIVTIWPTRDLAIAVAANLDSHRARSACDAASKTIERLFTT